ncbi:MAG: precorrin-6y C5,15-methyltransferase (decarboxylating) subunit CbiE [Deltaproteobacteria bacterium]|nr:precorrin-6y C5,15-methyltransferase (decarboxylating) subunit CbiE [Deltaproteobacteria bacterium]
MIYVIGIGVEGKDGLSKKTLEIIGRASLIAGGRRLLEEFSGFKARRLVIAGGLDRVFGAIRRAAGKGDVAVLATGDPLLFGIGAALIKEFGKKQITVIPNVSVAQEAFARIKESANGVKVLSVHGRGAGVKDIAAEAAVNGKLAVFTDAQGSPAVIAKALIEGGVDGFTAYVCEAIGTKEERITKGRLKTIAAIRRFAPLNVLILIKDKGEGKAVDNVRRFGIQDKLFIHSGNMITKEELRVIALSKLDIKDDSVVWDIGSGSGSVAIEAARLCPKGKVWAIEKNRARVAHIKKNKAVFGVKNIKIINGNAPACINSARLLAPDAVFVGGGGVGLISILGLVSRRLLPGGRVVVNAITLETAGSSVGFFKKKKWGHEGALIGVTKTKGLGGRNFLSAENPVFIISAVKPQS